MQARRLPAARGTFWLFEGFRLFRRNPPLITSLTLAYLMVVQILVVLLPGIGPILLPLLLPVLTLIVANGCRLVDENLAPSKALLLRGISDNARPMLRLGSLQLAGAILLVLINLLLNDGADPLANLEATTPNMADPAMPAAPMASTPPSSPIPPITAGGTSVAGNAANPDSAATEIAVLGALFKLLLLAAPLIVAFWFAPFLVGWDRVSPAKSLFFSWIASWRNLAAMGMFSLGALLLAGVLPGLILIAVSQIAGLAVDVAFVALRMLLIFFVAPILTASIYVSYRDIFHSGVDDSA